MRRPQPKTMSVADAAWLFYGIKSERAAFAALKRGDIIAIRIGRRWRVPIAQMEMKIQKLAAA